MKQFLAGVGRFSFLAAPPFITELNMATYTPVIATVRIFSAASFEIAVSGAALSRGMALYLDSDDDQYKPAVSTTQKEAKAVGFAFTHTDADGESFALVKAGTIGLGVALPVGSPLIVSNTAGKLCDIADAVAGWWVTVAGIPKTADELPISFMYSPVAKV